MKTEFKNTENEALVKTDVIGSQDEADFYPWSSQEEKDFEYSIMDEYYAEETKFHENNKRISDRILKILKAVKSEEWYSELMEYSKEAETHNPFAIVRKPKGQYQGEDEYELLGGVWVEQSSSYPCEDCYYGTVTVKIDEKRYLEMPFAC